MRRSERAGGGPYRDGVVAPAGAATGQFSRSW